MVLIVPAAVILRWMRVVSRAGYIRNIAVERLWSVTVGHALIELEPAREVNGPATALKGSKHRGAVVSAKKRPRAILQTRELATPLTPVQRGCCSLHQATRVSGGGGR